MAVTVRDILLPLQLALAGLGLGMVRHHNRDHISQIEIRRDRRLLVSPLKDAGKDKSGTRNCQSSEA